MTRYETYGKEETVPVIFADYDGIITAVNRKFEEDFRWPADQLVGRSITAIIPAELHDSHNMGFSRYAISGQPTLLETPLDLKITRGDGEVVLAEHFIVDMKGDGQELIAARIVPR